MKRILLALILVVAGTTFAIIGCQDKLPPVGPNVGSPSGVQNTGDQEDPPECEPDCFGGVPVDGEIQGHVSSAVAANWKYLWKNPGSDTWYNDSAVLAVAGRQLIYAVPSSPPTANDLVRITHLMDQDGQADQIVLAKAMVWRTDPSVTWHTTAYTDDGGGEGSYTYKGGTYNAPYHTEVWHAIRNMLKNYYSYTAYGTPSCGSGWGDICNNGEIGLARNLLPYLVAADYVLSTGPPNQFGWKSGGVGSGHRYTGSSALKDWETYDSLRVFVRKIVYQSPPDTLKAPTGCGCSKSSGSVSLYSRTAVPDNKGAAALASYGGAAIFGLNMGANPTYWQQTWGTGWWEEGCTPQAGHACNDAAPAGCGDPDCLQTWHEPGTYYLCGGPDASHLGLTRWCGWSDIGTTTWATAYSTFISRLKGWSGDTASYTFPAGNFGHVDNNNNEMYWATTWVLDDSIRTNGNPNAVPIPVKRAYRSKSTSVASFVAAPKTVSACNLNANPKECYWDATDLKGMPVEDMRRSLHTPRYACDNGETDSGSPACKDLVDEGHIAGCISYIMNAATLAMQYDSSGNAIVLKGPNLGSPGNEYIIPEMASWYDSWAGNVGGSPDSWPTLANEKNDWPTTYLHYYWASRVSPTYTGVTRGVVSGTRDGSDANALDREGKQMSFTNVTHP
jgi:hypothetical protein